MITSKQNNTAIGNIRLFRNVRVMIISGLFVSLSIILGKFLQIPIGDSIRISFENLPIIMAGIFFGPFVGGAVGISADLIGCLLKGYAINPIITFGAMSIGFMSGLVHMLMVKKRPDSCIIGFLSVFPAVFSAHIIGSMLIKSIGLYVYYHTPMEVLMCRIPIYTAITLLESIIISALLINKAFFNQLEKVCNYGNKL